MKSTTNVLPNYTEEVIQHQASGTAPMDEVVAIRIRRNGEEVGHLVRHFRHTVGSLASAGCVINSIRCIGKRQALELAKATAEEVFGDRATQLPILRYVDKLGGVERADRLQAMYRQHGHPADLDEQDHDSMFNAVARAAGFTAEELHAFYSRSH